MTPKEKAIDLTADFYDIKSNEPDYGMDWEMAKKSALITVEELIKEQTMWQNGQPNPILYWQEVKKEIEIL